MAAFEEQHHEATVQGRVTGIIYPPPDTRAVVDKTAQFVASNGRAFESRIVGERMSAKFSFLREADPYHAYYEHKVSEFIAKKNVSVDEQEEKEQKQEQGQPEEERQQQTEPQCDVVVEKKAVQDVTAKVAKKIREKELQPPQDEKFVIKHPTLSALDQEVMYLTAQYTALSGSSFLSGLATREQRNPQFDFLKPTHPLFAYFTALLESYTQVLGKSEDQMRRIEEGMERMKVLDRCVHRMEWQRSEQERKDKEAAESDAERRALAQVDWQDFIVVETITFDDTDDLGASATAEGEAKASDDEDMDMGEDDEEEDADDEPKPDIKVVEDYVPHATATAMQQPLLSVDGKTLSSAEANEHMRIKLMNPKWREETQRHLEKQKESSYAAGSAIADSLRRFATKRADIFASSAEEEARLLQATTAPPTALHRQYENQGDDVEEDSDDEDKTSAFQKMPQVEEEAMSAGFGVPEHQLPSAVTSQPPPGVSASMVPGPLIGVPDPAVGMMPPGIAPPGVVPPVAQPGLGILGMNTPGGQPCMLPPGMAPSSMAPPGIPPPGVVPPHILAPGAMPPGVGGMSSGPPGVSGPPGEDLEPAAKRHRTGGSSLLPEDVFAARHPGIVRLLINVPNDSDNAHWKLEGQVLTIEVDVKANMRTVKQKISAELSNMPANKQQLKFSMGFVKDALTCAHYNFVNDTVLELSVRQRGGRR